MSRSSATDRRKRFRAVLEGPAPVNLASIFDAASARLASAAGYELGFMAGSIASAAVLSAPDIVVLTLTEFADQARRIGRGSDLPLLVDADHGYGNALNVMRTIEEMENAGVAALTIEDTVLPRSYGVEGSELITHDEFRDKLRAALTARVDPSLVVMGRTGAITRGGLEEAVERAKICDAVGVDAIFVVQMTNLDQVKAIRAVTKLPIMSNAMAVPDAELAAQGVRLLNQGHNPYYAMLQSLLDSYTHLVKGGAPAGISQPSHAQTLALALEEKDYNAWAKEYLGLKG